MIYLEALSSIFSRTHCQYIGIYQYIVSIYKMYGRVSRNVWSTTLRYVAGYLEKCLVNEAKICGRLSENCLVNDAKIYGRVSGELFGQRR